MRAREEWSDVGWTEEEVVGQTSQRRAALDRAWGIIGLGLLSIALALVAAVAWPLTAWPWPVVLLLAVLSAVVGVEAVLRLRRRRVRHLGALVVSVLAATNGVGTAFLVGEQVVRVLTG